MIDELLERETEEAKPTMTWPLSFWTFAPLHDECCTEALPAAAQSTPHMTFDSPEIIYYGPHACSNCGVSICKMAFEFGGNSFTYPEGPIYPNTIWHLHVCDPKRVASLPKAAA